MAFVTAPYRTGTGTNYTFKIDISSGSTMGNIIVNDSNGRNLGTISQDSKFTPTSLASTDQKRYFSTASNISAIRTNVAAPAIDNNPSTAGKSGDILGTNVDPASTITSAQLSPANVGTAIEVKGTFLDGTTSLRYPTSLGTDGTKQDFIKFEVIEYGNRSLNNPVQGTSDFKIDDPSFFGTRTNGTSSKATVYLPITSGISDENSVQWGGEELNAITAYFAGKSFQSIEEGLTVGLKEIGKDVVNMLKDRDSGYANALKTYLAGQAVGTNNLLSRTSGAIINPNLELLFQGPSLRPFNFNFRLSPRDQNEAIAVKQIIRVFKEANSVRAADQQLFLKAPHVFRIKYIDGSNKRATTGHKSLNLIKECALLSCSVNYTPENTYMTFNDSDHTMVSYELSLRFSELEPITSADYNRPEAQGHPIGY